MSTISMANYVNQTQDPMRRGLILKVTNESVFMRILAFVPVDGMAYHYGEFAKLPGVAFRTMGQQYNPDSGVVNPKQEVLAMFGGEVRTDQQMVNKQGDVARANAIMGKTRKIGLWFDKYCIDADPANDPKQFYGLKARLTGNQVLYAGDNGGNLDLDMIDDLLDRVAGRNQDKVLVMNKRQRRALSKLYRPSSGGEQGRFIEQYEGARIEVLDEDGDEQPILPQTETRGNSNVTSSIYCIRPGTDVEGEWVQGLVGSKMVEHYDGGKLGTQVIDVVEMHGGLAVFHGRAAARLAGLL